jgi:lycopene cyclase domain-containing protein
LSGLCAALLLRPSAPAADVLPAWLRPAALLGLSGLWLLAVWALAAGWKPATYLGLELVWALPPIALQVALGGQSLWQQRRAVLATLLPLTLYLCAADALAIYTGVWHIAAAQSLNLMLAGLPLEEAVFFLLTNTLVIFGVTLVMAPPELFERLATRSLFVRVNRTLRLWLARA